MKKIIIAFTIIILAIEFIGILPDSNPANHFIGRTSSISSDLASLFLSRFYYLTFWIQYSFINLLLSFILLFFVWRQLKIDQVADIKTVTLIGLLTLVSFLFSSNLNKNVSVVSLWDIYNINENLRNGTKDLRYNQYPRTGEEKIIHNSDEQQHETTNTKEVRVSDVTERKVDMPISELTKPKQTLKSYFLSLGLDTSNENSDFKILWQFGWHEMMHKYNPTFNAYENNRAKEIENYSASHLTYNGTDTYSLLIKGFKFYLDLIMTTFVFILALVLLTIKRIVLGKELKYHSFAFKKWLDNIGTDNNIDETKQMHRR